uniref:G_PROTEIN_RECEP_F1_2 domain-containing protein n=1 Tax=Angiostrongylus cantonensis TaxID=6313 RepID=A0A0K0DDG9_ANGCA
MAILSIVTVVGNLAVLLSYYLDKNIRQPSNYFIFSLAVSDLEINQYELNNTYLYEKNFTNRRRKSWCIYEWIGTELLHCVIEERTAGVIELMNSTGIAVNRTNYPMETKALAYNVLCQQEIYRADVLNGPIGRNERMKKKDNVAVKTALC